MDYQFFQLLSDRIDRARGDGRMRLIELRETLLRLTQEVDRQVEARQVAAQQLLGKILQAPDVTAELEKNLPTVDDFFLQEVSRALQLARQQGDLDKINKLQTIVELLQSLSAAAPEVEFIEALVEAPDETSRQAILEANRDKVTPELLNSLVNIVAQVESSEDKELAIHLKAVHRQVLRFSMQANLST
jgi:hypothetical protein